MAGASCRSWRGGGGGREGERRRAAIPFPSLDWADYTQVSAAARRKKKRITCVQIELSVWKRGDAIISTGWVIIADQAHVSVRDGRRWMRQSLTNEGFYMCEVRRGGVPRGLAHAARLLLSDCFPFYCSVIYIYIFFVHSLMFKKIVAFAF